MTNTDLHRKFHLETGVYSSDDYEEYVLWLEERYLSLSNDLLKRFETELSELFNKEIKIEI